MTRRKVVFALVCPGVTYWMGKVFAPMKRYVCKYCGRPTKLTALSRHTRRRGHWALGIAVVLLVYNVIVHGWLSVGPLAGGVLLCFGIYLSWVKKPSWVCEFCGIVFKAYASEGGPPREDIDPLAKRYAELRKDSGTGVTPHLRRGDSDSTAPSRQR